MSVDSGAWYRNLISLPLLLRNNFVMLSNEESHLQDSMYKVQLVNGVEQISRVSTAATAVTRYLACGFQRLFKE